jgi:prepilin-type N-terminal cleavage/methylation domain-containing protein
MSRPARDGFTLIELVIVVVIIAILIGLLLPASRRTCEAAERTKCYNNLRELVMALHSYRLASGSDPSVAGVFPTGCIGPRANPEERLGWMVALLPYLGQDALYRQLDVEKAFAENLPAVQTRVKIFECPASKEPAMADAVTTYVAMAGIGLDAASQPEGAAGNGFMGYDRLTSLATIKDGTSNTIALMETRSGLGPWARGGTSSLRGFDPGDLPVGGDKRPFGGHVGGMSAVMADGSVRFISSSIDPMKLAAAITIAGEESVDLQ